MNFSPMPTCVWNLPMSEPNSIRSLALTSSTTRSVRWVSSSSVSAPP